MARRWWRRAGQPGQGAAAAQADSDAVPASLVAWAQAADVSRLSEQTVRDAEDYLRRYRRWTWTARREQGLRLMAVVETQVSPPPPADAFPLDVLSTVLAVRRRQLGTG
jgi:hypothetical protein